MSKTQFFKKCPIPTHSPLYTALGLPPSKEHLAGQHILIGLLDNFAKKKTVIYFTYNIYFIYNFSFDTNWLNYIYCKIYIMYQLN